LIDFVPLHAGEGPPTDADGAALHGWRPGMPCCVPCVGQPSCLLAPAPPGAPPALSAFDTASLPGAAAAVAALPAALAALVDSLADVHHITACADRYELRLAAAEALALDVAALLDEERTRDQVQPCHSPSLNALQRLALHAHLHSRNPRLRSRTVVLLCTTGVLLTYACWDAGRRQSGSMARGALRGGAPA
jgi:hypothetical protein